MVRGVAGGELLFGGETNRKELGKVFVVFGGDPQDVVKEGNVVKEGDCPEVLRVEGDVGGNGGGDEIGEEARMGE